MKYKYVLRRLGVVCLSAALLLSSSAFNSMIAQADMSDGGNPPIARASVLSTINYKGTDVTLSQHALYVDASLNDDELGSYAFKTIQAAVTAAQAGTKENPTVIYLSPDVYWTDDYTKPQDRPSNDLIGLQIPQAYITLAGMTGNPEDVIIASDRGQNAGADGNFNTIGVGDGFHAKDITIGNYCNVDLVYKRDTSKNHTKRQESVTQAQAVTKVPGIDDMDEWFFENCHIISRLNLFSRDERPKRSYLKDCYLECTDDSLGTGYITIFDNCKINLYSNTPCGGASFYMQAYLGCEFTTSLSDNKTITLCKNTKPFAFIDCNFNGDIQGMEWKPSNLSDDLRQIVYNNKINGKDLIISPSRPELSVTPDAKQLEAFKYNGQYNIYNLLNGAGYDEWDPLGQKGNVPQDTWNIQFTYDGQTKDVLPELEGNKQDSLEVTPVVLGGTDKTITWSVADDTLSIEKQANGNVIVKGNNTSLEDKKGCLIATASNGMQKVLYFNIKPEIVAAPVLAKAPVLSGAEGGSIKVDYSLNGVMSGAKDNSQIKWYKASKEDGSDKVLIAQTTYVKSDSTPYSSYVLRASDVDSYIFCEITPKASNSETGTSVMSSASRKITANDIADENKKSYDVDFEHLTYINAENDTLENNFEWKTELKSGNWYGGFYLPKEYRAGGIWEDKAYSPIAGEAPFTFGAGASGAEGTYGLQTTTQGSRLVYVDNTARKDMKMSIELSPHKTGAQGFGSAKQFMDIYFKYDAATMTGYGVRIARVPDISDPALSEYAAKSCTFTLMEYKNGEAIPLEASVISTAFLPGCTVNIEMKGNVLSVDVTTTSPQDSTSPKELVHEVHISHTFAGDVNEHSGFGFQHTGTAGAGKSGNRVTIHSLKLDYNDVNNDDNGNTDNGNADINNGSDADVKPDSPDAGQSDQNKDGVQTADMMGRQIALFAVILAAGAAVMGVMLFRRRRSIKIK